MRRAILAFVVLGFTSMVLAQHSHSPAVPAAKSPEASHHAFLDMERQALERGEGFGMALAADRAGYPGPKHVLELKEQLQLTPEQAAGMEKLFAEMKQQAVERGREVLNAEKRLEEMFAVGRSEDELREETYRIASLRAELRWVHLRAHLAARKLLAPHQVHTYMQIRHGAAGSHPAATK
jgi:hypothetical protein